MLNYSIQQPKLKHKTSEVSPINVQVCTGRMLHGKQERKCPQQHMLLYISPSKALLRAYYQYPFECKARAYRLYWEPERLQERTACDNISTEGDYATCTCKSYEVRVTIRKTQNISFNLVTCGAKQVQGNYYKTQTTVTKYVQQHDIIHN